MYAKQRHRPADRVSWVFRGTDAPFSVQFKGEISGGLPRKRHQKRHLDFCTPCLTSRRAKVRVLHCPPLLEIFPSRSARSGSLASGHPIFILLPAHLRTL